MKKAKFDKILTKEFLIKEYIKNKKSTNTIAKKIGCSGYTICLYLKKRNIIIRTLEKENNPSWIDGRTINTYYCKEDNCSNKICKINYFKGKGRCGSCARKGKNNPAYIHGNPICLDCGKELKNYYAKRCLHCAKLGQLHPMFGIRGKAHPLYIHGKGHEPYPIEFNNRLKEKNIHGVY